MCSVFTVFFNLLHLFSYKQGELYTIKTLPLISLKSEIWAQEGSRLIAKSF